MAREADYLADRRRMKRRLRGWRLAALVLAVIAVIGVALSLTDARLLRHGDHIARVTVSGIILNDRTQQELFDKLHDAEAAKAVIVHVDSPGGTTAGSEALFAAIRRVAADKPVVAVMGDVAASGGYIAALGADHIVARGNTITGSIGVIFQWANLNALLEKLGVDVEQVKSGLLKAEPNPFASTPEEAREVTAQMVEDSHEWFVDLVAERRPFDAERARTLSDGRVYTGRQALEEQLIDALGGEHTALTWLRETHGLSANLKVVDWSEDELPDLGLAELAALSAVRAVGLEEFAQVLGLGRKTPPLERLSLDGLIALWHPEF